MKNLKWAVWVIALSVAGLVTNRSLADVVTSVADAGAGSLRDAIAQSVSGATISFDNSLSGQTIALTSGQLVLDHDVSIDASALANGITISGNNASRILFTMNNSTVVLKGLTLVGGVSFSYPFSGGAIYNSNGCTLFITNCLVATNTASGANGPTGGSSSYFGEYSNGRGGDGSPGSGGGIYNGGTMTLAQSTICGNRAQGGAGGAGTYARNTPTDGGNGGNGSGGGIYNAGTLTVSQCTISGNTAQGGAGGGGASGAYFFGRTGLAGSGVGGGIYNNDPNTCLTGNSLIAVNVVTNSGNGSGNNNPDVSGSFTSLGNNLIRTVGNSTGFVNNSNKDIVGTAAGPINPTLSALANNGGTTFTMALQPGSPAIDNGNDTGASANDQRGSGFPRLSGQHLDIGAYEFQTTGFSAPSIVSQTAGGLTLQPTTGLGSATIGATVNPNGLGTTAWIEFGVGTAYGATTAPVALGYGNVNVSTNLALTGLPPGVVIHYRVVAVNGAGTTFGSDQTLNISARGDFDGDTFVSQTELNSVYANFVTNSPWLYMTNTAGLGGTNVSFTLGGAATGGYNYTVEYSTNLITWFSLGSATSRYLFTDTNAPALPQRYYRLRYP